MVREAHLPRSRHADTEVGWEGDGEDVNLDYLQAISTVYQTLHRAQSQTVEARDEKYELGTPQASKILHLYELIRDARSLSAELMAMEALDVTQSRSIRPVDSRADTEPTIALNRKKER